MKLTLTNPMTKLGAAVSTYLLASSAYAQTGTDVSSMSSAAASNIYATTEVLSTISYVIGAFFGLVGIMSLKAHADNPGQVPMGKGIGRLAVGALLCALPFALNTAFNSMGVNETQGVGVSGASDRF